MGNKGLDIGTNMLVAASINENGVPIFKMERDAYYKIVPKSEVNKNSIRMSLEKRGSNFIIDGNDFIVVGNDALEIAIERNDIAKRPMQKGIVSPKDKDSMPMLKLMLETLVGKGEKGDKVIYSVPAKPIDSYFDIVYHTEIMGMFLNELGYEAYPINESFAIALNELLDEGLTGISISCLVPGTKIYTERGILNVEDVKVSDRVITHKGRYKNINNIITKNFSGVCTKIQIQGYANTTDCYKFVDNHELYVYRDNNWIWLGCEDLKVGDIVGEPIIKRDYLKNRPSINLIRKTTNSKKSIKEVVSVTSNIQRLIGYFLGDGSVCERGSGIQFDFHSSELDNINDVTFILQTKFGKKVNVVKKGPNCIRVKCFSKSLAKWFNNNCYDSNREKKYPWSIDKLSYTDCLNLLSGLIRSDGKITTDSITFYNTSSSLIVLVKQLFSKIGITASICFREPRAHFYENRVINGTKLEWCVNITSKSISTSLIDAILKMDCENSVFQDKLFMLDGFCCGKVQKVEYEDYCGRVYDLQVDEDHSFSGPFLTIHNCGAGMVNVAVIDQGDPLVEFSITRSGDYIDQAVGSALDISPSLVQLEKESGVDLTKPSNNKIIEAVKVYYTAVIKYTLENIAYELKKREKELPIFRDAVPVVVSGGLTLANGFTDKVSSILETLDLPMKISKVIRAENPMTAVAGGALLASNL